MDNAIKPSGHDAVMRACLLLEGPQHLAEAIGTSRQLIEYWMTGSKRGAPAEFCASIEVATGGRVTAIDLRPDIFGLPIIRAAKIAKSQGRSVPEWIGAAPDTRVPSRVKLRVFERYGGKCHLSGIAIQVGDKWDLDHIKRLEDGGENRESNLAPALRAAHAEKTASETKVGRKADKIRKAHLGIKREVARPITGRGFEKAAKPVKSQKVDKLTIGTGVRHVFGIKMKE